MIQELQTRVELLGLVPLAHLLYRYQTTTAILEDRLSMFRIEPQDVNGELCISLSQVHQLDLFYERLKLGWALSLLQGLDDELKGV